MFTNHELKEIVDAIEFRLRNAKKFIAYYEDFKQRGILSFEDQKNKLITKRNNLKNILEKLKLGDEKEKPISCDNCKKYSANFGEIL